MECGAKSAGKSGSSALTDRGGVWQYLRSIVSTARKNSDEQKFARAQRYFVFEDAVFGNVDSEERRAERAGADDERSALQRANDQGDNRAAHRYQAKARNPEAGGAEEQAPQPAPGRAVAALERYAEKTKKSRLSDLL